MAEGFEETPRRGIPATHSLDCANLMRQISLNPLAARHWDPKDTKTFLGWLLWESKLHKVLPPHHHRQDMFILHSLLSTGAFHVDDLLCPFSDGVVETALSLAVERNDVDMIRYLLQMGASPDVLVGPVLSHFNKPSMYASDRPCLLFHSLIVELGKAPTRLPIHGQEFLHEMEYDMEDNDDFCRIIQSEKMVDVFDKGIEFEIAQLSTNPDIGKIISWHLLSGSARWVRPRVLQLKKNTLGLDGKTPVNVALVAYGVKQGIMVDMSLSPIHSLVSTWTRIQRAYVYARLNQRRPNGPLEKEFEQISLLLTYKGDITVDSYLIDEAIEKKTALYEALARRNLPEVKWLLEVQKADPNQVCLTGGMMWDEVVAESYPLEQALRGFLVTTAEHSTAVGKMMELLLVHGCSEVTQGTSLRRTLMENWSRLSLVCLEVLHFMHMTNRLYDRSPNVFTQQVRNEFNLGFPLMLRSCERKWLEEELASSADSHHFGLVLQEVPAFLRRITPPERFELLPASFRALTTHRAYRSLATLLQTYGGRASLVAPFSRILHNPLPALDAVYNDLYQALECRPEDVVRSNRQRVAALVTIMARLWPVTPQVKAFLLQYVRVLTSDQHARLDDELYSLRNRAVSVVQQEMLAGRVEHSYVLAQLPPTLYKEIFMSGRELAVVATAKPVTF